MNIFMHNKKCPVKKIKETPDGWNLYPTDNDKVPIFIKKKDYSGKMPPFFRWPWQKLELNLCLVHDFQVSASLNGHTLFEILEEDYPLAIKELLKEGEKLHQEAEVFRKNYDATLKEKLNDYLKGIALNPNLEDELSTLKLCLRVYMKLHLFNDPLEQMRLQRLNLMMLICKMAQRIYMRHVNEERPLGIALASFKYSLTNGFPHYRDRVENYEKLLPQQKDEKIFELYYEVDELMSRTLLPIKDDSLKRYLNYLTREVLGIFSDDMACLDCHNPYDARNSRISSDERTYRLNYGKMKLLKYKSFVLPEVFTDDVVEYFICNYNLK